MVARYSATEIDFIKNHYPFQKTGEKVFAKFLEKYVEVFGNTRSKRSLQTKINQLSFDVWEEKTVLNSSTTLGKRKLNQGIEPDAKSRKISPKKNSSEESSTEEDPDLNWNQYIYNQLKSLNLLPSHFSSRDE